MKTVQLLYKDYISSQAHTVFTMTEKGEIIVRVRWTRLILLNFMLIDAPYMRVSYTDGNMLFSLLERSCVAC